MTKQNDKKKAETATETSPETPKSKKKSGASVFVASEDRGYGNVFKDWEFTPCEEEVVSIKPSQVLSIFDTRAQPPAIDKLLATTKDGINTIIGLTRMKFLGEDGAYNVSPEPDVKVKLKKGEVYYVLAFGRCRTRAALAHGFSQIQGKVKPYTSVLDIVKDAHSENAGREEPTQWDLSVEVQNLQKMGATQEQIAATLTPSISAAKVSQQVAVFALPDPVQALFRDGQITVTHARALRPLAADPDEVLRLANKSIQKGWSGDELHEHIKQMKEAAADKKEATPRPRVRATDFSAVPLKACTHDVVRTVLSNVDHLAKTKAALARQAKAQEDLEKYGKHHPRAEYLRGLKQGFLMGFGVEEIPPAFLQEDTEEESSSAEE